MADITVSDDCVHIRFTTFEKIAGLIADQDIPLAAIRAVEVVHDPIASTAGLRSPGLAVPGRSKIGTWRGSGTRHLVRVTREQPAVRIEATGQRYDAFIVGRDDAVTIVNRIRDAIPHSPRDGS